MPEPEEYFIAVHGGAGSHQPDSEKRTKHALRLACKKALESFMETLNPEHSNGNGNESLTLVEQAIISLEDDPYLNAGRGSNLTLEGTVECDAALHASCPDTTSSQRYFGSVGAVSGIKNPISAARSILEYSRKTDKLGRIPPMTLVSNGATNFVQKYGTGGALVPPEDMITPSARRTWKKWMDRLESEPVNESNITMTMDDGDLGRDIMQDTVGAVAWHPKGGFVAGVSSGGILLKFPGRVGEAAIYGAGCWAQRRVDSLDGIACSVSGTGEEIVRANLARSIGEAYIPTADPHELLQRTLVEQFWSKWSAILIMDGVYSFSEPAKRRGVHDPAGGVLMIVRETEDGQASARVWCGFTAASMAVAFASSRQPKPKAYILRRPEAADSREEKARVFITSFKI